MSAFKKFIDSISVFGDNNSKPKCDWPECDKSANDISKNANGAFVCSEHFSITNGKTTEQCTDAEVAAIVRIWLIAERRKAEKVQSGNVDAITQYLLRGPLRSKAVFLLVADHQKNAVEFSTNISREALKRLLLNTAFSTDNEASADALHGKNIAIG